MVGTSIFAPILYKRIIDLVSGTADPAAVSSILISTVLLLGGVLFGYNLFFRGADYAMTYAQSRTLKDIADDAFAQLERHSYEFFSSTFTGSLVAKVRRYVNAFEQIHDQIVFSVWMHGLGLLFSVAVLFYYSRLLGFVFLAWLVLYIGITAVFVGKKIPKDLAEAAANTRVTGALADAITNVLNIKMYASSGREHSRFAATTDIEEKRRREAWNFQNLQFMFQGFFVALFEFAGMFAAVYLWLQGAITAGTIILMQIYIFASFDVVWNIGRNFTRVMRAFAEAKEMVDIFEKPLSVKDPENPEKCQINEGYIKFENITFRYTDSGTKSVFRNLSININPGEKV